MKILVTGAKGFVGKNLIAELKNCGYRDIYEYDVDNSIEELDNYARDCEFVFHLAGVNRPENPEDFMKGNYGFTLQLLEKLRINNNKSPILLSSSIQAELDNPYGKSKKAGEDLLLKYSSENNVAVYIYRLPNLFGKWSRPNYNSVVATFCYNIARDLEIKINDPNAEMTLAYIDDVIEEFKRALNDQPTKVGPYCYVPITYKTAVGKLAETIMSFKETRRNLSIPDMSDPFTKKLYSTYLSYLPEDGFSYGLKMNIDDRGSFTEFIKTIDRGQFSVNVIKPGITKGNHWHHTKNEKFLVVYGKGVIRFRRIDSKDVIEYRVSGDKLEVVDIPPGYTHNIQNVGDTDMVVVMWANELYDPQRPDTYYLEV